MSAFKRKDWDRNDLLQIVLYHDSIQKNENGWFNVDKIINHISGLHRGMNKPEYDFKRGIKEIADWCLASNEEYVGNVENKDFY